MSCRDRTRQQGFNGIDCYFYPNPPRSQSNAPFQNAQPTTGIRPAPKVLARSRPPGLQIRARRTRVSCGPKQQLCGLAGILDFPGSSTTPRLDLSCGNSRSRDQGAPSSTLQSWAGACQFSRHPTALKHSADRPRPSKEPPRAYRQRIGHTPRQKLAQAHDASVTGSIPKRAFGPRKPRAGTWPSCACSGERLDVALHVRPQLPGW